VQSMPKKLPTADAKRKAGAAAAATLRSGPITDPLEKGDGCLSENKLIPIPECLRNLPLPIPLSREGANPPIRALTRSRHVCVRTRVTDGTRELIEWQAWFTVIARVSHAQEEGFIPNEPQPNERGQVDAHCSSLCDRAT
jgi:hypothetical protein